MYIDTVLRTQFGRPSGRIGSVLMRPLLNVANKRLIGTCVNLLDVRPKDHVLDVGFGGGYSLRALAAKAKRGRITGLDYSPDMVSIAATMLARESPETRTSLQCGDAMHLPYADRTFDRILTVNSIYYWSDLLGGLREMARVLKNRGRLAVGFRPTITLRPFTLGWQGFHLYEPEQVAGLMHRSHFRVLRVERTDQWLPLDGVVVVAERS
ncbi:MAG: class I SAM-dependent methyltransferase [Bryobacteraceae bacterium]